MSSAAFPAPAWLVGCGNMAGAMIAGWREAGVDLSPITVIRPSGTPVDGVKVVTDYPDARPRFVMLGVKPQKLDEVVPGLFPHVRDDTILVSILAGTSAASLADRFPDTRAIVRAMPNLPVAFRQGVIALYAEHGDEAARAAVGDLMEALGFAPWVDSEDDFAAIGAVAGSGPAYVARFTDALADGARGLGLEAALASRIAVETLVGTAAMAETGESLRDLARRVASPNGTTEQGLAVLDDPDEGLSPLVERMLGAAIERGRQLAAEAARRG